MTRTTCALLLTGLIVVLSISRPAEAWVAYRSYGAGVYHGAYGSTAAWGGGSGAYHSAYGGSASWSHGSGSASGAYGGSASWSHGSGSASGAYGGSASWSHGSGSVSGALRRLRVVESVRPRGKKRLPQEGQGQ